MKRIRILGEEYEAEQIERKQNEVTGRTGGKVVFRFAGIRDMSTVELLDGAEWSASEVSVLEGVVMELSMAVFQ